MTLNVTISSLMCGCNIWSLFLAFLLSVVKCKPFTGTPEDEGDICCLNFYCLVVYEDLIIHLLLAMSHVQQHFI